MDTAIIRHDDSTFTEVDADGNELGYGDWRDEPPKTHYHVYFGAVGCLPDDNMWFHTKRDALAYLRDEAAGLRFNGRTVRGSAESGYDVDAINRFSCESCTEAECLSDN